MGDSFNSIKIDTSLNAKSVIGEYKKVDILLRKKENELKYNQNLLNSKKKELIKLESNQNSVYSKKKINKEVTDTHIRLIQISKYNSFKYDETIHLLYILCFVFVLSILIIISNINNLINNYLLLLLLIIVFILYLLYVLKILVIDNVNINNFIYEKYDFNKPSQEEIRIGSIKDNMYNQFSARHDKNDCPDNTKVNIVDLTVNPDQPLINKVNEDSIKDKDDSKASSCYAK